MRFINPEHVRRCIPSQWHTEAAEALEQIRKLSPEERKEKIDKLSDVWKHLKGELHKVSHGKCWYCETSDVRHDDDVDHWRPKNAVNECKEHEGYWWLAFSWQNYRYTCMYCNQKRKKDKGGKPDSGGKGTSFPLLNEEERIFNECTQFELLQEKPFLLDPMVWQDTLLIQFDTDGMAYSAIEEPSSIEYQRVDKSIEIYHLNAYDLKERRRTTVCNQVERLVQEGKDYLHCLEKSESNYAAKAGYYGVVNQLWFMLGERAEYSMAAKSVLRFYRKQYPWVIDILKEVEAS